MSTVEALARLRLLAAGLPLGDVARLLERVAAQPDDERDPLDAALRLLGAAALLGEVQAAPSPDRRCAGVAAPLAPAVRGGR